MCWKNFWERLPNNFFKKKKKRKTMSSSFYAVIHECDFFQENKT